MKTRLKTRRKRGHIARELVLTLLCAAVTAVLAILWFAVQQPTTAGEAGTERGATGMQGFQGFQGFREMPSLSIVTPRKSATEAMGARMAPAAVEPSDAVAEEAASDSASSVVQVEQVIELPVSESESAAGFQPTFDGRVIRPAKKLRMLVTAYSPDERSCGIWADGITASGYSVHTNATKLVAADTSLLPFGTILTIPGYNNGWPVPVLDRGGAIKGSRLDVLYPTHEEALVWGKQWIEVTVWEYAD